MASTCCNCNIRLRNARRRTGLFNTLHRFNLPDSRPADVLTSLRLTDNLPLKQRFLCAECSKMVAAMARAEQHLQETVGDFCKATHPQSYISNMSRKSSPSPEVTPQQVKKLRVCGPLSDHIYSARTPLKHGPECLQMSPKVSPIRHITTTKPATSARPTSHMRQLAIRNIKSSNYNTGLVQLFHCSSSARKALHKIVQDFARAELKEFISPTKNIALRQVATADALINFSWDLVAAESRKECPVLTSALLGALTSKRDTTTVRRRPKRVTPIIGTVMAIICFLCKPQTVKIFQVMNSIQMWLAGCKRKIFSRFNQLGLCMGLNATLKAVDNLCANRDENAQAWRTNQENIAKLQIQMSEGDPNDPNQRRSLTRHGLDDNGAGQIHENADTSPDEDDLVMLADEILVDPNTGLFDLNHRLKSF